MDYEVLRLCCRIHGKKGDYKTFKVFVRDEDDMEPSMPTACWVSATQLTLPEGVTATTAYPQWYDLAHTTTHTLSLSLYRTHTH